MARSVTLDVEAHLRFLLSLQRESDTFEYWATEFMRMSGVYWALSAASLLGGAERFDTPAILAFVASCRRPDGGYAPNVGHDSHLLSTLSAVQILALLGALDGLDADARAQTVAFVAGLQEPDGSFAGDEWGEVDTRFSYCAAATLALLGAPRDAVDVDAAIAFLAACQNWDGGFGVRPGAESHAGQAFCVVGALATFGGDAALGRIRREALAWWLCERQLPSGGLNGRPEKVADVCYSWWVVSALAVLGRTSWIDADALAAFILRCADAAGGFADKPGNVPDPYHTFFAIAGLSLCGRWPAGVCPRLALPPAVVAAAGAGTPLTERPAGAAAPAAPPAAVAAAEAAGAPEALAG